MTPPFEIQIVGGSRSPGGPITDIYVRVGMNTIGPLGDDEAIALAVALREQTKHTPLPHPNGGGLVDQTATVTASAFVGPRARVRHQAQVLEHARIEDDAVVSDTSVVSERARVFGNAQISGASKISGEARVSGFAKVQDAMVMSWAIVRGHAVISEGANVWAGLVLDRAVVTRRATVGAWCVIGGDAVVDELADVSEGMRIGGRAHLGTVRLDREPRVLVLHAMCTSRYRDAAQTYLLPSQLGAIDPSAPPVPLVTGLVNSIDGDESAIGHGWYPLAAAVLKLAGREGEALALHYGPWLAAALITYRSTGVPPGRFYVIGLAMPEDTRVPRKLREILPSLPELVLKAASDERRAVTRGHRS